MRRLLIILLTISICSPALAKIADPNDRFPWPTMTWTSGWLAAPTTIRVEFLQTPLGGGTPIVVDVCDVNVVPVGFPPQWPDTQGWDSSGEWGWPLLLAIADHNELLQGWEYGIRSLSDDFYHHWVEFRFWSAPGTRLAFRAISTAATPLPAKPWMPPITAAANNWPPSPWWIDIAALSYNYDCNGCEQGNPLGILGGHYVAVPPDWIGTLSADGHDDRARFMMHDMKSDLDFSRTTTFTDFSIFAKQWCNNCNSPDWCYGCDFDNNGAVDIYDLDEFTTHWLETVEP